MTMAFRRAVVADVPDIVRLLAEDSLGQSREEQVGDAAAADYLEAFAEIDSESKLHLPHD